MRSVNNIRFAPPLLFLLLCVSLFAQDSHWRGEEYAKNASLQSKWAQKFFFDRFRWSGDEQVLDIGCGDGKLTAWIAEQTPLGSVLGIDDSLSMIEYAKKIYAHSGLDFQKADAGDRLFYEEHASQFDLIVSFHCLHWVADQKSALSGIEKALKPSGKAFLRLASNGFDPVQEMADRLIQTSKWRDRFIGFQDPIHRYSVAEYLHLIKEAGLLSLSIEEVIENDLFETAEDLAKQIKSWLPHLSHLRDGALQEDFLNDLLTLYLQEQKRTSGGAIPLFDCYLEVEIEKPKRDQFGFCATT